MADEQTNPEQDPAEGSRETVERQLKKTSKNDSGTIRKPDMPSDGPRGGETNETTKPTV